MRVRSILAGILGRIIALMSMPLGCGGAQEDYVVVSQPGEQASAPAQQEAQAPESVARQMKACIEKRAGQWPESSYAAQYNVEVNDRGKVLEVKLRDTTLQDSEVERCLRQAIAGMTVPAEVLRLRLSRPVSGGESMSSARESVGIVQAAVAPIALAPIIIPALGVTIIVAISLDIIRKAASGPDCKQIKQECIEYCSETTLPTPDFGWKFQKCKNDCLELHGCPRGS